MKPLLVLVEIDFSVYKKAVKKSQQILTALFITFTYVLFLFFQKFNASVWEVGEYTGRTRFIQ